jgi:four helix bundle protein
LPVWQEAALLYGSVLDLLDEANNCLSVGFRAQLDRSALSVSNNIAEGFERMSTAELLAFLEFARGSAGEVRSMMGVIRRRVNVRRHLSQLDLIRGQAESCSKQIGAWMMAIERSPIKGKRHLASKAAERREHEVNQHRAGTIDRLGKRHGMK